MIIGLSGYARTGKDTIASMIIAETEGLDQSFQRRAFADPLKDLALAIDPIIGAGSASTDGELFHLSSFVELWGWEVAKDRHPEVRRFLQALGEHARGTFGDQVWVDGLRRSLPPLGYTVVTDVRYANEARQIREWLHRNVIVRVHRPGYGPANGHASETELDSIIPDFSIVNDLDFGILRTRVRELLVRLNLIPTPDG